MEVNTIKKTLDYLMATPEFEINPKKKFRSRTNDIIQRRINCKNLQQVMEYYLSNKNINNE